MQASRPSLLLENSPPAELLAEDIRLTSYVASNPCLNPPAPPTATGTNAKNPSELVGISPADEPNYWDVAHLEPGTGEAAAPTLLDPEETSSGRIRNPAVPAVPDEPVTAAMHFRHSFWRDRRPHIFAALQKTGQDEEVLKRFEGCGCNAWVMRSKETTPRLRLASDRCHNRWCEACAAERRRLVCRNLRAALLERGGNKDRLRFLTLTLAHTAKPLREQLDRLYSCWQRLRQTNLFKRALKGSLAFFETKVSTRDGLWHCHLHVLCDGDYLPKEQVSQLWKKITGDSYIIDVKLVRNPGVAAGYVAKYAAKAVDHSVWRNPDKLHEAMLAFRGRRLFNTTGTFAGMKLSKRPEDDVGWEPLMPLHSLIAKARAGEPEAIQLFRQLGAASALDPIDAYLPTGKSPPLSDLPGTA